MSTLDSITNVCHEILPSVASYTVGFAHFRPESEGGFSEKERVVLELLERLDSLREEARALVSADSQTQDTETAESEAATSLFPHLVATQTTIANPILRAIHSPSNPALRTASTSSTKAQATPQDTALLSLLQHRDRVGSTLLHTINTQRDLTNELSALELRSLAQLSQNRTLVARIHDLTSQQNHNEDDAEGDRELRSASERVGVVRSALRGLVLESGVDWVGEEGLRGVMLGIEEDE
ncbi:hypothetical protein SAICODRAFT_22086 [Saitoella complicata NRRL Y-17804]|uniref:Centromere protein H C-terminal domain-containing protein n=1 Tax=Saitoella complicata (strain BCRC 22490 / CBS 7301 / JCM 7358 / NBRC 10748 / NRRL Y-17804) TaxID=698492 RepID=A0A0E9NE62_SAICN|nr:uncharacterized protein SAICODRAFT_22086 [Saitoella complicata NRRL Y-17804]ODQ49876.1 hypothetical protein SAICODRAFT_22086 [Saitoella complicata NRRL Y-17804]GAO47700.1 hypothetical protein G7K_1899-t1 [Saitoella complicata NRRL Y-17804]